VAINPTAQHLGEICDALRVAWQGCKSPDERAQLFDALVKAKRLHELESRKSPDALVFVLPVPGIVYIGWENGRIATWSYPDCINGLAFGWDIFAHGACGNGVLYAQDYVGNQKRPAQALRNRLGKAARWLREVVKFPELAAAFESPAISVRNSGEIVYNPEAHPPIKLKMFEACSHLPVSD